MTIYNLVWMLAHINKWIDTLLVYIIVVCYFYLVVGAGMGPRIYRM